MNPLPDRFFKNGRPAHRSMSGPSPAKPVCYREDFSASLSSITSISAENSITCTTFNILAPIYKRIGDESSRESEFHEAWFTRNKKILDMLLRNASSIICLQELWLGNEELVQLYEETLIQAGYHTFKLPRTNNKGDGLFTAIKSDRLRVLNYKELPFFGCGDRVAQIFHLRFKAPFYKRNQGIEQELLLVNTHLIFPHDFSYCIVRLRQVYRIIEYLEQFKVEHSLSSLPVILCGDWNGSKRGQVYKFLQSQGFESSYDIVHEYTHKWVSHRNHRGNICGVDFIWLYNPNKHRKPLSISWKEAVLGIIKAKLDEVGMETTCFIQENGVMLSPDKFKTRLRQLGVTKREELDMEEIKYMLVNLSISEEERTDLIGKEGMIESYDDESWSNNLKEREKLTRFQDSLEKPVSGNASGFDIHEAFLYPPEVEQGLWPEDYSLSDHAPLTAIFRPHGVYDG